MDSDKEKKLISLEEIQDAIESSYSKVKTTQQDAKTVLETL